MLRRPPAVAPLVGALLMAWPAVAGPVKTPAAKPAAVTGAKTPPMPSAMSLDLTTGKTDASPLVDNEGAPAFSPNSPPQTVEGTLKSVDPSGSAMTVHTPDNGDVAVGLPPSVPVSRDGENKTVADMHPGDDIHATVVTAGGNRALHVVADPPMNPLVSIIGIPALLLIALWIYVTGRRQGSVLAEPPAKAKA